MLVLLGPSGCGKTTLLRCIAGLERPDSGMIGIAGTTVFDSGRRIYLQPNDRPISMVYQSYALWPHMTVYENVVYPLRCRGVPDRERRERVETTLELVGLKGLGTQHPGRLSGGQQQRVALARSVVSGTGVILFDEPLSNVDAQVREQVRIELLRMQRALGFSALYVTHDQTEAMAIGHRIAVIRDGKVEQLGTPEEIYLHPSSEYVGSFVGHPNLLRGALATMPNGRAGIQIGPHVLECSPGSTRVGWLGREATALIRPERVSLHRERPDCRNAFAAAVETRSFLGMYTEYSLRLDDIQWRAVVAGQCDVAAGARAWASVAPQDIMLFDKDGHRIGDDG